VRGTWGRARVDDCAPQLQTRVRRNMAQLMLQVSFACIEHYSTFALPFLLCGDNGANNRPTVPASPTSSIRSYTSCIPDLRGACPSALNNPKGTPQLPPPDADLQIRFAGRTQNLGHGGASLEPPPPEVSSLRR
jgi:hypothetical protein